MIALRLPFKIRIYLFKTRVHPDLDDCESSPTDFVSHCGEETLKSEQEVKRTERKAAGYRNDLCTVKSFLNQKTKKTSIYVLAPTITVKLFFYLVVCLMDVFNKNMKDHN